MKLSEKKNDLIPGLTEHEWQFLQKMYTFLHTEAIPKGLGASSDEKAWAPILKDGMLMMYTVQYITFSSHFFFPTASASYILKHEFSVRLFFCTCVYQLCH